MIEIVPPTAGPPRIGILERNRSVLGRVVRVVRAATGLSAIAAEADPAALREQLGPTTELLLCDAADLELACAWATTVYPGAQVIAWCGGPMDAACELAARHPQVQSVIAWPSFQSMPRAWEVALAVRRARRRAAAACRIEHLFAGPAAFAEFRPSNSRTRDLVASELMALAERAGAPGRLTGRIGESAHELLMNAIYDAPVNHYGQPRYAQDRRAEVQLEPHEIPTARFACDGTLLAIQVVDPFGRLTRDHVLRSVLRGQAGARASTSSPMLDTSNGGAGLGLWRIYATAALTIVEVVPGHSTSVTAVFDIDVSPREARTMPSSLHLFDGH